MEPARPERYANEEPNNSEEGHLRFSTKWYPVLLPFSSDKRVYLLQLLYVLEVLIDSWILNRQEKQALVHYVDYMIPDTSQNRINSP